MRACVWRTAGDVAPGESMRGDIPSAADQPYVDPLLQKLREDMRDLLGQLEGRKVPLTLVSAAWNKRIGTDAAFDLMKYQKCISRRKKSGAEAAAYAHPGHGQHSDGSGPKREGRG